MKKGLWGMVLGISLVWATLDAQAGTFQVNQQNGSDTNSCGSGARRSIRAGLQCLNSGDTLEIAAGTYAEGDLSPPSGTTVRGARGTRPVVQPGGQDTAFVFAPGHQHITLDGLVIDGGLFPIATTEKTGMSHIKVLNSEIKNARGSCFLTGGSHWEIRHNHIHHCGRDTTYDHGLYFYGEDSVIANNLLEHNACFNIQNYPNGSRNTYDSNVFTGSGCGVVIEYGGGHRFRNNLMYDDASQLRSEGGGVLGFLGDTLIEGNVFVRNGLLTINGNADGGTVVQNNTFCEGQIRMQQAQVRNNRMTCAGLDVQAERRKRVSARATSPTTTTTTSPTTSPAPRTGTATKLPPPPRQLRVLDR